MATLAGTLTLNRTILTEVTGNPNVLPRFVVAGSAGSISGATGGQTKMDEQAQSGSFRQYGNGNTRLILGAAIQRVQTFALMALNPTQVATLRALLGHTVCYRDPNGTKVFGAFLDLNVSNVPHSGKPEDGSLLTNVGIQIQSVTFNEAV